MPTCSRLLLRTRHVPLPPAQVHRAGIAQAGVGPRHGLGENHVDLRGGVSVAVAAQTVAIARGQQGRSRFGERSRSGVEEGDVARRPHLADVVDDRVVDDAAPVRPDVGDHGRRDGRGPTHRHGPPDGVGLRREHRTHEAAAIDPNGAAPWATTPDASARADPVRAEKPTAAAAIASAPTASLGRPRRASPLSARTAPMLSTRRITAPQARPRPAQLLHGPSRSR